MRRSDSRRRLTARLFAIYAVVSLLPVLVLGVGLAAAIRQQVQQRGLAEGRSEARLVAQTAVEPQLSGEPLASRLDPAVRQRLERLVGHAVAEKDVLRLRVRDLAGRVVFSDDGSGFRRAPEDEALDAAAGHIVAHLTRVNSDTNDTGATGVSAVEVYLPLRAGTPSRRVGVLEVYLPYEPIRQDLVAGLHRLYLDIAVGLAVLYVLLFAITLSVSRGLRREVAVNAFLAEHDTLTELPNRTLFQRRVQQALAEGMQGRRSAAVAIIDLDHFKEINDTLGHHNGDHLLTEIASRLARAMHPGDTVARLGGDEFGLVLRDITDPEPALQRLRELIDREVEVGGLPVSVQASIGFVLAPDDGATAEALLQRADVAMYVAKAQHLGVVRYDPLLDQHDAANLGLVSRLRTAIDEDELVLHYQPQVDVADGRVVAVEALVRWQHPELGLLYPDRFLPLAEQTDLIDNLTSWVLRTALRDLNALGAAGADLSVAVNVSARSVGRTSLAADVELALEELGVPAQRLIIEVTETALLSDPKRAATVLARLAAAGVRISLDDFGRGHTSLGYLSALPIHELKIDRQFVTGMLENAAHAAIVRSIIELGHNLGLHVVGEGVETVPLLDCLRQRGCDIAQGYLMARPMPLPALSGWLHSAPSWHAAA